MLFVQLFWIMHGYNRQEQYAQNNARDKTNRMSQVTHLRIECCREHHDERESDSPEYADRHRVIDVMSYIKNQPEGYHSICHT
jgi:hypothetical protein